MWTPRQRWGATFVAAVALATASLTVGPRLLGVAAGERDWSGAVVYRPPHPVRADALSDIDFEHVHSELLPVWQSRLARHGPDATSTKDALRALQLAVASDGNLAELARELGVLASDPAHDPERLLYLTWAWSNYLDRAGLPWTIQGSVRLDADGKGLFYTKNYEVVADLEVRVGDLPVRARLVERVDRTNVVERYLGQVSNPEDGAFVVIDRVRDAALDVVWPLLDPASPAPYAAAVQAEVASGLSAVAVSELRAAAPDRARLVGAVGGMRARRACGSGFVVPSVPWDGFEASTRARLYDYAEASTGSRCPTVTHPEAVIADEASQSLQQRQRLEAALGELVAWVARGVVVHEARHVADTESGAVVEGNYACEVCGDGLSTWARAEASAYLASTSEIGGAVAFAEMCAMVEDPTGLPEHYRDAVTAVTGALAPRGCAEPPADLLRASRAAEIDWFRRAERIGPTAFPAALRASAPPLDRYKSFAPVTSQAD